ncbi:MAG: FGGY family carbohydrate kinase, partial [Trueperaceae bacterium]
VLGNPPAAGFTGPSLAWVQDEEPEAFARTRRVRLAKDHLRAWLVGDDATDPSDASATLLFDPFRRAWASEACRALGLNDRLLPPVRPSNAVAGTLTAQASEALGLPRSVPVVTGAGDQAAAAMGVGLTDPGTMLVTIGSGGQAFAPLRAPRADPKLRVHLFVHAAHDRWHLEGAVQNVGLALDWARSRLAMTWDQLYDAAASGPAGAEGATFVPYLTGERTPWFDPSLRADWVGLSLSHDRQHLARAAIEGTTFALVEAIVACREAGADVDRTVLTGGGAESALTRSIVADLLNAQVHRAEVRDASARGAAVLAGAPAAALRPTQAESPGPDADAHRDAFARYRAHTRPSQART